VAEVLLPHMTESELEEVGVTKANELRRLVLQGGNVGSEILSIRDEYGNGQSIRIMDYAADPKVTAAQLRVKVNELLHQTEAPKGLWYELPGFYATSEERKEINDFWSLGKEVLEITSESEHEANKEVFLAAVRESISTWSAGGR
jgi:hypothetical protein